MSRRKADLVECHAVPICEETCLGSRPIRPLAWHCCHIWTVLVASHVMSELEELATDIVFLLEGGVRFSGKIADLKATTGEPRLERAVARIMTETRP